MPTEPEARLTSKAFVRPGDRPCPDDRAPASESQFVRACKGQPTDCTPVWLMRQAGRFIPEYRQLRARLGFLELCKKPDLAAELTVMAVEKLGVDAGIIFADILLPLEALGVGLEYAGGEGPVIGRPLRCREDLSRLRLFEPADSLSFVLEAIGLARSGLPATTPLIGFAGAPFTLASYLVEGGASRHFENTKRLMYTDRSCWHELMRLLSQLTADYLNAQVAHGVQAVQLFDSWVGCLSQADYREFVLPYTKQTIAALSATVPLIHFGTGTAHLLELMLEAGGDVIGLDWRVSLSAAWARLGERVAVQGNLDPVVLLADQAEIKRQTRRILLEAGGKPGHVFNLGHGVLPTTPVDNVRFLVDTVHELGGR